MEEEEEVTAEAGTVQVVRFKDAQHFEVRTLTPSDWLKVGVEDGQLIHWHKGNNFQVPVEEFKKFLTEDQFNQYILGDPRMELVEVEK